MNSLTVLESAPWRHFETIESTNQYLLDLGEQDAVHGMTCTADVQTLGKGRGDRRWISPPGGLYMSILLKPDVPVKIWHMISLVMACASAEAIEQIHPDVKVLLKWPNDVLVNNRKCAGILVQSRSGRHCRLVVGIGVNIAVQAQQLPRRPLYPATVLNIESRYPASIHKIGRTIRTVFFKRYIAWQVNPVTITQLWNTRSAISGAAIAVETDQGLLKGRVLGLSENGALCINSKGIRHELLTGDIIQIEEV